MKKNRNHRGSATLSQFYENHIFRFGKNFVKLLDLCIFLRSPFGSLRSASRKYRYLLFLSFFIIFLFLSAGSVLALELTYPNVPVFGYSLNGSSGFPDYVRYFFGTGIALAGVLALISFTVGAVGLIAPNVEAHSEAKDRMWGAVLGLVLIMASYLIMQTINTKLTGPSLTQVAALPGVTIGDGTVGQGHSMSCPGAVSDMSTLTANYKQINYACPTGKDASSSYKLAIWDFTNKNLEDGNKDASGIVSVTMHEISCGNDFIPIAGSSFKISFETPGVYFFQKSCSGYMSSAYTNSQSTLESTFSGKIGGAEIVNGLNNTAPYYGAIFHQVADLKKGGKCSLPLSNESASGCQSISSDIAPAGVDIYQISQDTPIEDSPGVIFYSATFGEYQASGAGYVIIKRSEITHPYKRFLATAGFSWDKVDAPEAEATRCPQFNACPGSVAIYGDYLLDFYSMSGTYCQTFTDNIPNLKDEAITATGAARSDLSQVFIIPLGNSGGGSGEGETGS